jgi:uncharacterized protein YkwD
MRLTRSLSILRKANVIFGFVFVFSLLTSVNAQPKDALQKAIFDEYNLLRANPASYAKFLEAYRPTHSKLQTFEGVAALDEAVRVLKTTPPLGKVDWNEGLFKIADAHAKDLANTGRFSHDGSDGSKLMQRASRIGQFSGYIGEAISSYSESARVIVMQWLIDDGNRGRGHRKILLEKSVTVGGVTTLNHSKSGFYCVLVVAGGFNEGGAPSPVATTPNEKGTTTTTTGAATSTVSSQAVKTETKTETNTKSTPSSVAKPKPKAKRVTKKPN